MKHNPRKLKWTKASSLQLKYLGKVHEYALTNQIQRFFFWRSEYMCIANLTSWSCFHGMSWADVHLPAVEAYRRARGKDRCGSNWWILRSMPFSYCWWTKSIKSLGWQDPIMGLFTDVYDINNPSTGPRFCRSTAFSSTPWTGVHPKLWMIWRFFTFRCKEMVVDSTFNFEKKRLTPTRCATVFCSPNIHRPFQNQCSKQQLSRFMVIFVLCSWNDCCMYDSDTCMIFIDVDKLCICIRTYNIGIFLMFL